MTKTDGSNTAVCYILYKDSFPVIQILFISFEEYLVYYQYRAGAMRKADAAAIAADNPTACTCDTSPARKEDKRRTDGSFLSRLIFYRSSIMYIVEAMGLSLYFPISRKPRA